MATPQSQLDSGVDIEKTVTNTHLQNTTVKDFAWRDITVTVKDKKTKESKVLLKGVNGVIKAGTAYPSDYL